jgi:hypothetical protein
MSKKSRMQRRQFLAASGMVLAQAAMLAGASRAQPLQPAAPPTTGLPLTPSPSPLTGALPRPNPGPKIGVSPMYNTTGSGQNPYNPHFLPQGGPSNRRLPTPRAVSGEGVKEGTP